MESRLEEAQCNLSFSSLESHEEYKGVLKSERMFTRTNEEGSPCLDRGWFWEISTLEKLGNHYFSNRMTND